MNEFLWCKFRCASVLKNKLVFLQSVKYTLASQQYSLVVTIYCTGEPKRQTGSMGRHAYRVTHVFIPPLLSIGQT